MRGVRRSIGVRLFVGFALAAIPVLLAAGLLLEWQTRRALEVELARRAESLAAAISAAIPRETWSLVFLLTPGQEQGRTASQLRDRLLDVQKATGAEAIAVWSLDGRFVLDTTTDLPIGARAPRAALLRREVEEVRAGRTASTPLFRTEDGRWVKVGLAPLGVRERGLSPGGLGSPASLPLGVLLVDAPAHSLDVLVALRHTLLVAGGVGVLLVLGTAIWLARALTRRIHDLVEAVRRVEGGDLDSPVPRLGLDEVGILATGLETMRGAVQARERQLRGMLGSVAHEIRNPLGGMVLYAEMLARDARLSAEQVGRAQRILQEATLLERVVTDFLSYARPERPVGAWVSLEAVVNECAENASAALGWQGDLRTELGALRVWCDEGHLRQIVLNLLRNAMQACAARGTIRASATSAPSRIEVCVEDSGPGIPGPDQERVFEPFYGTRAQGAGLGLAIVKRLCDLNGLEIRVDTSPLGGARFTLAFRPREED